MQSSSSDALFYPCFVLIAFLASACETAEIDGRALIDTAGTANAASSYRANSAAGVEVLGEDSTRQVHDVSGNDLAPRPNPSAGWQPILAETGGAQPLSGTEAIGGAIVNARAPVAGVSTPSEAGRLGSQSAEREGQAALAVAGIDSMTNAGWHIQGFSGDQTDSEALAAAIRKLFEDDQLRDDYASRGLSRAEQHFCWNRCAERMEAYYRERIAAC